MRSFLCNLTEKITGKPRYQPQGQWDKHVYVANIFRLWEYIFGREEGVRAEVASYINIVDGKLIVKYKLLTFEAVIVHVEVMIRSYFLLFRSFFSLPQPRLDYRPVYLTLGILGFIFSFKTPVHSLPLFGLAIAHDTDTNSGVQSNPTTYNWSHTVTGSNPAIAVGFAIRPSGADATCTYNSVALTDARAADTNGNRVCKLQYQINPSTGANSIAATLTGSPTNSDGHAVSLSGVSGIDANNGANNAGSTTPSVAVTTVADNCFIIDILCTGLDDGVAAQGASQTLASKLTNTGAHTGAQSYTTAAQTPAGSKTMSWTVTNSNWCISAASFSPVVASTRTQMTNQLLTGVGM